MMFGYVLDSPEGFVDPWKFTNNSSDIALLAII